MKASDLMNVFVFGVRATRLKVRRDVFAHIINEHHEFRLPLDFREGSYCGVPISVRLDDPPRTRI